MTTTELPPIVVERVLPFPPERVWTAISRPDLMARWLMQNDFEPVVGHAFTFRAQPVPGWSGVTHCRVLTVDPHRELVYTWGDGTESDSGLQTVLTWTLTPVDGGTHVRMVHSGFHDKDRAGHTGMGRGWATVLNRLEAIVAEVE